jgi:hypothetical protein
LDLDEPLLVRSNTISTVGVLSRLTVGGNEVNDVGPGGVAVALLEGVLVDIESLAARVGQDDGVVRTSVNEESVIDVLRLEPQRIGDDMAVVGVRPITARSEAVGVASSSANVGRGSSTVALARTERPVLRTVDLSDFDILVFANEGLRNGDLVGANYLLTLRNRRGGLDQKERGGREDNGGEFHRPKPSISQFPASFSNL